MKRFRVTHSHKESISFTITAETPEQALALLESWRVCEPVQGVEPNSFLNASEDLGITVDEIKEL